MTNPVVLVERPAEGVALLRINRPDARNALNMEVRKTIAKHLTELAEDSAVRCIVLTGNERSFAASADIKEMAGVGFAGPEGRHGRVHREAQSEVHRQVKTRKQ